MQSHAANEAALGPSRAATSDGQPVVTGLRSIGRRLNEPLNVISHGAGVVLAAVGMNALLQRAGDDPIQAISFLVYGMTMVLLYASSTALHLFRVPRRWYRHLRRMDHAAIYLFIAGTHTPLCTITLGDPYGWPLLATVWAFATAGVLFKLVYLDAPRWLSTISYLATGWMALFLIWPLSEALPGPALVWLLTGGLCYTAGSLIFLFKKPNPLPYLGHHEIWHLCVLAGSACHFYMIWHYVAQPAGV